MKMWFNKFLAPGDGGGAGGNGGGMGGGGGGGNDGGATGGGGAPLNAGDFATALVRALEGRERRFEGGVVRSVADQYGVPEDEAKAELERYKAEKANKLPEAAQKLVDEANARAEAVQVNAEIRAMGAAMGLLDAEAALVLLPKAERDKIKVTDAGVTGVKEALESLQKAKPYLFGTAKPAAMAQRVAGAPPAALSGVEEQFYARNPGLKRPV